MQREVRCIDVDIKVGGSCHHHYKEEDKVIPIKVLELGRECSGRSCFVKHVGCWCSLDNLELYLQETHEIGRE